VSKKNKKKPPTKQKSAPLTPEQERLVLLIALQTLINRDIRKALT
jgi:hypothetical protein